MSRSSGAWPCGSRAGSTPPASSSRPPSRWHPVAGGPRRPARSWRPSRSPRANSPRLRPWRGRRPRRLLAGDRKDRLAEVYRGFADRLLSPDLPTIPADPEGAYALLAQARSLAKGEALRASLLLAMARASQKAGNHARAIARFPGVPGRVSQGCRPHRGPLRPGRIPARRRPAAAGPTDLDRPGARPREGRHRAGRRHPRPRPLRDRQDARHPRPARRLPDEPRRRGPPADAGLVSVASAGRPRRLRDRPRRTSPGARARRRSPRSKPSSSGTIPAATTRRAASGPNY